MSEDTCKCGREAAFVGCPHVLSGQVTEISMVGTAASCGACSRIRPDDTFSPLCTRCLDRLSGPKDPEQDLEKVQGAIAKRRAEIEATTAKLYREEQAEKELQRRLSKDLIEELFEDLDEFFANFVPGGYVHKRYEALQVLVARLCANDSDYPDSLSKDTYGEVLDRKDPRIAFIVDQLRGGSFGTDTALAVTLTRLFKNKSDINPVWVGGKT